MEKGGYAVALAIVAVGAMNYGYEPMAIIFAILAAVRAF